MCDIKREDDSFLNHLEAMGRLSIPSFTKGVHPRNTHGVQTYHMHPLAVQKGVEYAQHNETESANKVYPLNHPETTNRLRYY